MCNIIGVIIYLRVGWAVGKVGILNTLLIFCLAGMTVTLTALSIAAISTNGVMKGGGAYYMISRSLGPELGGSVGVSLYLGNSISIAFYLTGFTEAFVDSWLGVDTGLKAYSLQLLISTIALCVLAVIAGLGAQFFSKLNVLVLAMIAVSVFCAMLSFLFGTNIPGAGETEGFTGWGQGTFNDNLIGGSIDDFFVVFAVVFPAVTGIMAGANMSGDLRDPGNSIGLGTLSAIVSSMVLYFILVMLVGGTVTSEALVKNVHIMQDACFAPWLVSLGIAFSTLSSALGALVGASRILQALARDDLIPILSVFKYGSKVGDEPHYAILSTWAIAQMALMIGNLDVVAGIVTNFFLVTYFATNISVFVLKMTGAPNFRPRFKYFNRYTAIVGAGLCLFIMFLSSPLYALVTFLFLAVIFAYIFYYAPPTPWGDVTQALIFQQVRKYLLQIDEAKAHPKFWRPSLLLITRSFGTTKKTSKSNDPAASSSSASPKASPFSFENPLPYDEDNVEQWMGLIDFCNNLKKGGLYVLGDVCVGDLECSAPFCPQLKRFWYDFIRLSHIKAFANVCPANTLREGCMTLMMTTGLGGMRPNTVVHVLPCIAKKNVRGTDETGPERDSVNSVTGVMSGGDHQFTSLQSVMSPTDLVKNVKIKNYQKTDKQECRDVYKLVSDLHDVVALKNRIAELKQQQDTKDDTTNGGDIQQCDSEGGDEAAAEFLSMVQDASGLNLNVLVSAGFQR
jgi:potassium/chloride transporter 9